MSTVLFVSDEHAFRTVFAETLRNAGHLVLEAATIADAEHLIARHAEPIDVIIVEAVLTTTNGRDVVERLHGFYPMMRSLFISDQPAWLLTREGTLPDGAHFLRKPFDAEDLAYKLDEILTKRPASAPAARS